MWFFQTANVANKQRGAAATNLLDWPCYTLYFLIFGERVMIELGYFVKDKVTGLMGVAENRATFLFGCDRYFVQPQIKEDGTVPEGVMIDEPQLEVLKDKDRVMTPAGLPEQTISLGQLVDDPVTGMTGTATGRAVYLNGCSRIFVEPKTTSEKHESWWVDEKQLTGKKTLIGRDKKTIEPNEPQAVRRTGGPARSCSKY
ncbi:hypothetical protein DJ031_06840 [bacterium endosymbiont of Escarpia laminata]|nr:MAG: hypothetical protein DJ031_06840 [bacterium endosymbiont of Escarpia laminata]